MKVAPSNRLFVFFEALVAINSPSGEEGEIAEYVRGNLGSLPLTEVKLINRDHKPSNNMLFKLPAREYLHQSTLLLSAHLDTVEPTDQLELVKDEVSYRSSGASILGSDDKSGVAIMLEILVLLHEHSLPHPPMEILFTEREEIGLLGAKQLLSEVFSARRGLILDADGPAGLVTYQAPFQINFRVEITGIPAHAGSEPEKGKSAILGASKVIQRLPFGRIDDETTLNIGKINGGKASNIVAEHTTLQGEIRSISKEKLDLIEAYVKKSFIELENEGYRIDFQSSLTYHGYKNDIGTPFLAHLKKAALASNLDPIFKKSGGGSDANILKGLLPDLECVVLSTGMQKVHTHQEYIMKKDLLDTAQWILNFIISNAD